jgi:hypothetical protein
LILASLLDFINFSSYFILHISQFCWALAVADRKLKTAERDVWRAKLQFSRRRRMQATKTDRATNSQITPVHRRLRRAAARRPASGASVLHSFARNVSPPHGRRTPEHRRPTAIGTAMVACVLRARLGGDWGQCQKKKRDWGVGTGEDDETDDGDSIRSRRAAHLPKHHPSLSAK